MEIEDIYTKLTANFIEQLKNQKVSDIVKKSIQPYKELMKYYKCAMMEVETKFSVLSEEVIFQYKCDNFYSPQSEGAIAWNDPDLNIDWRIPAEKVVLSEKDSKHPRLKDWQNMF